MNTVATSIISALVLVVAFMQWRTAHSKVMLDLFDRRMNTYRKARKSVGLVVTSGRSTHESELQILEAIDDALFVFGDDVRDYLRSLYTTMTKMEYYNKKMENSPEAVDFDRRTELFKEVSEFYEKSSDVFGKYMRMDQKRVRTPLEWLHDRNELRKSFADKP